MITALFLIVFKIIPKNSSNFDFIVYALGIVYAFVFFLIGVIQGIMSRNHENKYSLYKEQYINLSDYYQFLLILQSNLKSNDPHSVLHLKMTDRNRSKSNLSNSPSYDVSYIKYYPWFTKLEFYLQDKHTIYGIEETRDTVKIHWLKLIYIIVLKVYTRKLKNTLLKIERIFGTRLFEDIRKDSVIESALKEIVSNQEYIIDEVNDIKVIIERLEEIN